MRRGLFLSAWIFSFAALSFAQQVVVRSPNGLERLKKGDTVSIDWGCVQCSGTTELHLVRVPTSPTATMPTREGYQEIGVIKSSIPVTPAQQFYSYSWKVGDYYEGTAALGGGYKILVKIVSPAKTVSDLSDSAFVIGALPTMDYFAINDGLAVTDQRKVTLNYRTTGFPSPGSFRVRCTPTPGTTKDATLSAGTWPTYELPAVPGDYTIELWLMNDFGLGPSRTDAIRYEIPPPPGATRDYTVYASSLAKDSPSFGCQAWPEVNPAWYSCKLTSYSGSGTPHRSCNCVADGSIAIELSDSTVVGASPATVGQGIYVGSKAEYEFFGGRQLNEGWSFVSISYSNGGSKDGAGSAILITPQFGSRNILLKVRLWTDGGTTFHKRIFYVNSLVIRGPVGRPVSEAFK